MPLPIASSPAPGSLQAWAVALRPRSLWVAVSPVAVGAALAWSRAGRIDALLLALALLAALAMQVLTNLQNDVGYTLRGAERGGTRRGLPRATAQGWLSTRQVQAAIVAVSLLAAAAGVALALLRGWPVLVIGTLSLLAALAYMGGPRPIAFTPFGELTVFVFFGLVAVIGTDWLLSGGSAPASVVAAAAVGALAAAALAVNNHRDSEHDRSVGRRTFAVLAGPAASRRFVGTLLLLPFALLPLLPLLARVGRSAWLLLPLLLLPQALALRRDFLACAGGSAYNAILFRVFALGRRLALLLVVALLLAG